MPVELPSNLDVVEFLDERLATLEDPILKERLVSENPSLYSQALARMEREALVATSKRWGTFVLALTAAASIVAGYVLAPIAFKHQTPPLAAARPAVVAAPHKAPAPATHPKVVVRHAAVPVRHAVPPSAAHHQAAIAIVRVPVVVPPAHHTDAALRARLAAQAAEIRQLRAAAAAARPAQHRGVAPVPVPANESGVTSQAVPQAKSESASGSEGPTRAEIDAQVAQQQAQSTTTPDGTKAGPPSRGGTPPWTERLPGPLGGIGGVIIGTADPCTPQGGRTGVVLGTILRAATSGGRF